MVLLNIENVERLIFYNKEVRKQLPSFESLFKQWEKSVLFGLRPLTKKILLDFLNMVNDAQIKTLESCLGTDVLVDKTDYHIVKYLKVPISEAECALCGMTGYKNFTSFRDDNYLYICFWR